MDRRGVAMIALLVCFGFGCGAGTDSVIQSPSGIPFLSLADIENSTPQIAMQPVPEYEPDQVILISSALLQQYQGEGLLRSILLAGAPEVWIFSPLHADTPESPFPGVEGLEPDLQQRLRWVGAPGHKSLAVWARDWGPIVGRTPNGQLAFADFQYYARMDREDGAPLRLSRLTGLPRIPIPLFGEGGNFMVNGSGDCFMTSQLIDANLQDLVPADFGRYAESIKRVASNRLGCQRLHLLPRLPQEATGHIDVWAKVLNNRVIAVNQLRPDIVSRFHGVTRLQMEKMSRFLDNQALAIGQLGFDVWRLPMPAPLGKKGRKLVRSYSNALVVNQTMLTPRFKATPLAEEVMTDGELQAYENEVMQLFEKAGYTTEFVNSDRLVRDGGAIHCATVQVGNRDSLTAALPPYSYSNPIQ